MRSIVLITILAALASNGSALAQPSGLEDADIRCYSDESCGKLIGRKVWGSSSTRVCKRVGPPTDCRQNPRGSAMIIERVTQVNSEEFFAMRLSDGSLGFVRMESAHMLTFRDPRPAQEAAKKRAAEAAEKTRQQEVADAAALAAIPKTDLDKACILAAAERLPRIPGIQIASSKTTSIPAEYKPSPGIYMTIVEIDAKAAGQDATYSFLCATGLRAPTSITPLAQR